MICGKFTAVGTILPPSLRIAVGVCLLAYLSFLICIFYKTQEFKITHVCFLPFFLYFKCRRFSVNDKGLRVPAQNLRDFSMFHVNSSCKNCPSAARSQISLILRRSRTGTVWFYTNTSNKRAARPKLYTKSLTRDLKRMYIRLTLVRISINL